MAKTVLKFGKTTFIAEVPAGVSPEEIYEFAHNVLERAANKARSEGRALRAADVLQALRRAMTSRWAGSEVKVEE